jgi:hypothetical protein
MYINITMYSIQWLEYISSNYNSKYNYLYEQDLIFAYHHIKKNTLD